MQKQTLAQVRAFIKNKGYWKGWFCPSKCAPSPLHPTNTCVMIDTREFITSGMGLKEIIQVFDNRVASFKYSNCNYKAGTTVHFYMVEDEASNPSEGESAKLGIWTPWASVVCYECHGNKFPNGEIDTESTEWKELTTPIPIENGKSITICDECNTPIQVNDSVAKEHNVAIELRKLGIDAKMWQTGGMCSAVGILQIGEKEPDKDGNNPYVMITYNINDENEFLVGEHDAKGYLKDEFSCPIFHSHDEVIKYVKGLSNLRMLK